MLGECLHKGVVKFIQWPISIVIKPLATYVQLNTNINGYLVVLLMEPGPNLDNM